MGLDNIQLSPTMAAELFRKSLVELDTNKAEVKKAEQPGSIAFMGNHDRKIALLVNHADAVHISDDAFQFLSGILAACKLSVADVAIINLAAHPTLSYTGIHTELGSVVVLLLGVSPDHIQLPLTFPQYQIQRFNQQQYLLAPELLSIKNDPVEKGKLWHCLRQLFSI